MFYNILNNNTVITTGRDKGKYRMELLYFREIKQEQEETNELGMLLTDICNSALEENEEYMELIGLLSETGSTRDVVAVLNILDDIKIITRSSYIKSIMNHLANSNKK